MSDSVVPAAPPDHTSGFAAKLLVLGLRASLAVSPRPTAWALRHLFAESAAERGARQLTDAPADIAAVIDEPYDPSPDAAPHQRSQEVRPHDLNTSPASSRPSSGVDGPASRSFVRRALHLDPAPSTHVIGSYEEAGRERVTPPNGARLNLDPDRASQIRRTRPAVRKASPATPKTCAAAAPWTSSRPSSPASGRWSRSSARHWTASMSASWPASTIRCPGHAAITRRRLGMRCHPGGWPGHRPHLILDTTFPFPAEGELSRQ